MTPPVGVPNRRVLVMVSVVKNVVSPSPSLNVTVSGESVSVPVAVLTDVIIDVATGYAPL